MVACLPALRGLLRKNYGSTGGAYGSTPRYGSRSGGGTQNSHIPLEDTQSFNGSKFGSGDLTTPYAHAVTPAPVAYVHTANDRRAASESAEDLTDTPERGIRVHTRITVI